MVRGKIVAERRSGLRQRIVFGRAGERSDRRPMMGRWLVAIGLVLVVAGLAWPWLSKLGLGRLPGDIVIGRGSFRLYFPIVTCLLISVLVSLVLWLLRR